MESKDLRKKYGYTNIIQMKSVNTTLNFDSVNELHLLGISGWLSEKSVANKKNEYLWQNHIFYVSVMLMTGTAWYT